MVNLNLIRGENYNFVDTGQGEWSYPYKCFAQHDQLALCDAPFTSYD